MATNKRVFTLRLEDEVFDKIGALSTAQHRSMTNYIEYVLLKHIREVEQEKARSGRLSPKTMTDSPPAPAAGLFSRPVFP